ncbi:hypothetical protein [Neisseria bacilliformis]|nr:hypothetical protein [Neisseria bacilliformis]
MAARPERRLAAFQTASVSPFERYPPRNPKPRAWLAPHTLPKWQEAV